MGEFPQATEGSLLSPAHAHRQWWLRRRRIGNSLLTEKLGMNKRVELLALVFPYTYIPVV